MAMTGDRNIIVTMTLEDHVTGATKQIQGSVGAMKRHLQGLQGETRGTSTSFVGLTSTILKSAPAFAVATAAITGVYNVLRSIRDEFVGGIAAVEKYKLSVASMAGFVTQFSKKYQEGDPVGAFKEAVPYVKSLIEQLEILDAKTVANSEQLNLMAETFIKNRVQMNLANKEAQDGFVRFANALVLLTGRQNKMKQIEQEINGIYEGRLVTGNRVLKFLYDQNKKVREQLAIYHAQGKDLEFLGKQLEGFGQATDLVEQTWEAVGSTMETINTKIMRTGMTPAYEQLLDLAVQINEYFFENGKLTENGLAVVRSLRRLWDGIAAEVGIVWKLLKQSGMLEVLKAIWTVVRGIAYGWGAIFIAIDEGWKLLDNINEFLNGLYEQVKLIGETIWAALTFSLDDTRRAELDKKFEEAGKKTSKKFISSFIENVNNRLMEYALPTIDINPQVPPPEYGAGPEGEYSDDFLKNKTKNLREYIKDAKEFEAFLKRQASWFDKVATPLEAYDKAMEELNKAYENHEMNKDIFIRNQIRLRAAYYDAIEASESFTDEMKEQEQVIRTYSETVTGRLENAFYDSWQTILSGAGDFKDKMIKIFNDMVTQIIGEWMRMKFFTPFAQTITKGLGIGEGVWAGGSTAGVDAMLTDFFSFMNAKGNAFSGGISAMANKIYNKPTLFAFARGGVLGEAGPEAVMPLARTASGDLGVKTAGSDQQQIINVNITAMDSRSIEETMRRNPGAILGPFVNQLNKGNVALRSSFKRAF